MEKFKSFVMTSLLGGVMVVLPIAILAAVFSWVFNFVTHLIQPLTSMIVTKSDVKEFIAVIFALVIILVSCFFIGVFVRTRIGKFLFTTIEHRLLKVAPGYNMIKATVLQILGNKKSPFSSVALVQIFENDTLVTAFVTDEHASGLCTVFVPTGPNPTSGVIYHVKKKYVHPITVSVEDAMRSIISCGSGSAHLIEVYRKRM